MKQCVRTMKYLSGTGQGIEDLCVAREAPLTINLNGKEMATLLSSPTEWDELSVGFLLSEGLIKPIKDSVEIQLDYKEGMAWVETSHVDKVAEKTWQKRFITSGCASGSSFYSLGAERHLKQLDKGPVVEANYLSDLMKQMQKASDTYATTHGVHGAALGDAQKLEVFREDVGRHNALDKIKGYCFFNNMTSRNKILLSTGRISSEMLLKAARLETPIVVSRSAPTSLAVAHAIKLNITLVGMVRGTRLNVYTVPERIA